MTVLQQAEAWLHIRCEVAVLASMPSSAAGNEAYRRVVGSMEHPSFQVVATRNSHTTESSHARSAAPISQMHVASDHLRNVGCRRVLVSMDDLSVPIVMCSAYLAAPKGGPPHSNFRWLTAKLTTLEHRPVHTCGPSRGCLPTCSKSTCALAIGPGGQRVVQTNVRTGMSKGIKSLSRACAG